MHAVNRAGSGYSAASNQPTAEKPFRRIGSFFTPLHIILKAQVLATFKASLWLGRTTFIRIENGVKYLIAKIHAFFLNTYASVLSSRAMSRVLSALLSPAVSDGDSEAKIAALQAKLSRDVLGSYYTEASRFLGHYVTEYLKVMLEQGKLMPANLRPSWLVAILWERPDAQMTYTVTGQLLLTFLRDHDGLCRRYVELNILKAFHRFAEHLQKLQSDNRFTLLDLIQDFLSQAKCHLHDCEKRSRLRLKSNEKELFENEEALVRDSRDAFIAFFFPEGAKEIDLPLQSIAASYVAPELFSVLKAEIIPGLLKQVLSALKTPYAKTWMVCEGLELEKRLLSSESHPNVPGNGKEYPLERLKKLEDSLNSVIVNGFNFLIPNDLPKFFAQVAPTTLAKAGSEAMAEEVPNIPLQELVRVGIEKLLLLLNEDGQWFEKKGRRLFEVFNLRYEVTIQDKIMNEIRQKEKAKTEATRLAHLAETAGANPVRIVQLAQSKVFRTNHAQFVPEQAKAPSFFSSLLGIGTTYSDLTKRLTSAGISKTGLSELLLKLNQKIATKLIEPEHDPLIHIACRCVLKLFKNSVSKS